MLKCHILKPPKLKYFINSIPCYQWLIENSHLAQFAKNKYINQTIQQQNQKTNSKQ